MDKKSLEICERFIEAIDDLIGKKVFKNATDCAEQLGTHTHVISKIRKKEKEVSKSLIQSIMSFNISPNYLFGHNDINGLPLNIILLPDKVFAGNTISIDSLVKESQRFRLPGIEGEHFAFKVEGDSMEPTLFKGDFVICKRIESFNDIIDGDIYVFGFTLHKVKRVKKNYLKGNIKSFCLISDNPDPVYRPETYVLSAFEDMRFPIFHVVKKVKIENI